MLTIGVDLSAEVSKTCVVALDWSDSTATLRGLETGAGNEIIIDAARTAEKVGIDCPLGWPELFLDFVNEHRAGAVRARDGVPIRWRRQLANRMTDIEVNIETKLVPLSVAADRIAHVAFRCAALLAEMRNAGFDVDRSGVTGRVVEVYPAASLLRWELPHRRYKGRPNVADLRALVASLLQKAPWLSLGVHRQLCESNDDAFDAVVAALSARAAWAGRTRRPTAQQRPVAEVEGWIAIPDVGSLPQLPDPRRCP